MKIKKILACVLSSILCVVSFTSSIHAEQSSEIPIVEEYSPDKEYSCSEIVRYNDKQEKFEVVNKGDVIQTRASYTNKGSVNINGQVIYAYISVDASTGKIVSTCISQPPKGSGTTARYNISFNTTRTIAYFTITLYSTAYGGSISHALGTKYVTVYSGGPM